VLPNLRCRLSQPLAAQPASPLKLHALACLAPFSFHPNAEYLQHAARPSPTSSLPLSSSLVHGTFSLCCAAPPWATCLASPPTVARPDASSFSRRWALAYLRLLPVRAVRHSELAGPALLPCYRARGWDLYQLLRRRPGIFGGTAMPLYVRDQRKKMTTCVSDMWIRGHRYKCSKFQIFALSLKIHILSLSTSKIVKLILLPSLWNVWSVRSINWNVLVEILGCRNSCLKRV
jgi:hypothetical protein